MYNAKVVRLLNAESARDRFTFVAEYVVAKTARKEDRELSENYQVKKVGKGYTIRFGKLDPGYGVMDANLLYSWMVRMPLSYYMMQAENLRIDILTQAN